MKQAAPQGYGKAHFSMSVAQVRKAYPELREAPKVAGYLSHPNLQRFVLWHQKMEGLPHPVDVELRFWRDSLWTILFYCGDNSFDAVKVQLSKQFGLPASGGTDPTWLWPTRTLMTASKQGWYSIADRQIGKEAQTELAKQAGQPLPKTQNPPPEAAEH
ncbi:MAG: hypothetical protein HY270_07410 [Deltaproteobacteria bacterium]|nr:hypothetical protein [Deltaproteobacteria bacterium]